MKFLGHVTSLVFKNNLRIILRSKSAKFKNIEQARTQGSGGKSPEISKFSFVPPKKFHRAYCLLLFLYLYFSKRVTVYHWRFKSSNFN